MIRRGCSGEVKHRRPCRCRRGRSSSPSLRLAGTWAHVCSINNTNKPARLHALAASVFLHQWWRSFKEGGATPEGPEDACGRQPLLCGVFYMRPPRRSGFINAAAAGVSRAPQKGSAALRNRRGQGEGLPCLRPIRDEPVQQSSHTHVVENTQYLLHGPIGRNRKSQINRPLKG